MITCRALTEADLPQWRAMRLEALTLYPSAFLTHVDEEKARTDAQAAAFLAQGNSYAAFDGDDALGFSAMVTLPHRRAQHRAEVSSFYVRPEAQGTGAAGAMMAHMEGLAIVKGVWQMELFVEQRNTRALAFYIRQGYVVVGRLPNAAIGPEGPDSDLFMTKLLDNAPAKAGR